MQFHSFDVACRGDSCHRRHSVRRVSISSLSVVAWATLSMLALTAGVRAQAGCPCDADQNGDGTIDTSDIAQIQSCVGQAPNPPCDLADVNCDGVIDQADVDVATCQFMRGFADPACCASCVDGATCSSDADCSPGGCLNKTCTDNGTSCSSDADCQAGGSCIGTCVCKCAPAGGEDCFSTQCDGLTYVDFASNPIPAGYFFAGSPPFGGSVNLGGNSGFIDTVVRRNGIMCFPGPGSTAGPIPIEITQLQLTSCSPVVVGGTAYTMNVDLDPGTLSVGDMTATKVDPNGGTFTSNLNVNVLVSFTPLGGGPATPGLPRSVSLSTASPAPWVQADPGSVCNSSGFYAGYTGNGPTACCEKICHQGPTPDHPHCVIPPECQPCDPPPVPCPASDPGNDPCASIASTQCQSQNAASELCQATVVQMQAGTATAVGCECQDAATGCGPVDIQVGPVGSIISCPGNCTAPTAGNCEVFIDGVAQGVNSVGGTFPDGAIFTCDCVPQLPPPDPHKTVPVTSVTFGTADVPEIPGGFFNPGSDPFFGTVVLQEGPTPTLVQRSSDIPPLGQGDSATVDIEIVALSLVSVQPITVTTSGAPDSFFDITVDLSSVPGASGQGSLTATLSHPNGGTYDALLPLSPRLIFREVGNPSNEHTMDFGLDGTPPIQIQFTAVPWVISLDAGLQGNVLAPSDGNFVPGIEHEDIGVVQAVVPAEGTSVGGGVTHTVEPVTFCDIVGDPAIDPCTQFQQQDCQGSVTSACVPKSASVNQATGHAEVVACNCDDGTGGCGPIDISPDGLVVSCQGSCTSPDTPACQVWYVDGTSGTSQTTGSTSVTVGGFPVNTLFYCDCSQIPNPDPHKTVPGTQLNFGTSDIPAIPADFFDPGSDPFTGSVPLQAGSTDTVGQRSGAIVCPGSGFPRPCDPIQIQLVQLDLVSISPISVGGSTDWLVHVDLSTLPQTSGPMNATITHSNGGTYNAVMPVLPRLTFTRVGNPLDVRVLDYGVQSIPPVQLNFSSIPWVRNLAAHLVGLVVAPNDGEFVPGVSENIPGDPTSQTVVPSPGPSSGGGVTHNVEPVQFCRTLNDPAVDPCGPRQQTDCQGSANDLCLLERIVVNPVPPGGFSTIACSCFADTAGCGPIEPGPVQDEVCCPGNCAAPDSDPCQIWFDDNTGMGPQPSGMTCVSLSSFPVDTVLYCDCAPGCPNPCTNDTDCDDGNACTSEFCDATGCCQYSPICTSNADCDDGDACTTDTCNASGCCDHTPDCSANADCDDGDACTSDICLPTGCCDNRPLCTANSDCDDGDVCTTDTCLATGCCDNSPICVTNADCDDGDDCTIDTCLASGCCDHQPDPNCNNCDVSTDQSACVGNCPAPLECQPRCVVYDPLTGQTLMSECNCTDIDECHVEVSTVGVPAKAAQPVGGPCVVPEGPVGTVTLPPAGCDYLSPEDVHEIVDGLPAGTTIELAPIHMDFICNEQPGGGVCSDPSLVTCEEPGGTMGGNMDCFQSSLDLTLQGTGTLSGFSRHITIPNVGVEVHTGPRTPGDPVQDFDTDMFRLQGELFGDPDFCQLRITAGTDYGLPSPGHTTLTRLPGGDFTVDSFFDIEYRIDFQGCPGSALQGYAGSTTRTIRMQTGAQPTCVGSCPQGEICDETRTQLPDGTLEVCCTCATPTGACCLPGHICVITTQTDCEAQGGIYQGDGTDCTDSDNNGYADLCEPDTCRVNDTATGCVGPCPDPPCEGECIGGSYCDDPACCLDPNNCLCYAPNTKESIKHCGDCFGECINGAYCDGPNPDCCLVPGACACYLPNTDVSIQLCSDNTCFGECIGGSYCDGPDPSCCLAGPGNCQCYAPDSPISLKLCADPPTQPQECNPACVTVDPLTGVVSVTDCNCADAGECHVKLTNDTSTGVVADKGAGNPCVVPDDASGTITLPPAGCEYLSPEEVHEIFDNAGSGVTFELAPIHKSFICERQQGTAGFPGCPPDGICEETGGDLGGNVDCFSSDLELTVTSPDLPTFNRTLHIPVSCQAQSGPRASGTPVQSFDTKMEYLQGELFGDPDFCMLRVTGGNGFGMPSPGHTTLTRLPSSDFMVDSFFDIEYRIEWQGCPGSALQGMSGDSTATIRMRTGTTPSCEGSCNPDETCFEERKINADGTVQMCCRCGCQPVDPPQTEVEATAKNRYISVVPTNPGRLTALRVTLADLDGAYAAWNGHQMWVSNPTTITEQAGSNAATPTPTMTSATLSCQQDCRDWGALGLIDITHEAIVPGSHYVVQAIDCGCDQSIESNYSTGLDVDTSAYGDIVGQFDNSQCRWTAPNGTVSIPFDTVASISKFQNQACAPRKARTDLIGVPPNQACLDGVINITDILETVLAFQGFNYRPTPSAADPCNVSCP